MSTCPRTGVKVVNNPRVDNKYRYIKAEDGKSCPRSEREVKVSRNSDWSKFVAAAVETQIKCQSFTLFRREENYPLLTIRRMRKY